MSVPTSRPVEREKPDPRRQRSRPLRPLKRLPEEQPAGDVLSRFGLRGLSLGLLALLGILSVVVFQHPAFYVQRIEIGGLRYTSPEEIFASAGIANFHILWVDADDVAARVEASPSIETAQVYVRWPARVLVFVQEREPALQWVQQGVDYWVDIDGNLMDARSQSPNLIRVINQGAEIPLRCPGPQCDQEAEAIQLDPQVVQGALQLKTLRDDIETLYYDPAQGLGFDDARGWRVYTGVGTQMNAKLALYERIVSQLLADGIDPTYVNVGSLEAPFFGTAE